MARPSPGQLQMTLALIKPTVCSYQPDVSLVLKHIKSQPNIAVSRMALSRPS